MKNNDIQYFREGIKLADDEFFIDAINKFNMIVDEFPKSELADDALYNIGYCYLKMNRHHQAIETFNQAIYSYPEAEITDLMNTKEYGKTAAKCYYGIFLAQLALGQIEDAIETIEKLNHYSKNTYVIIDETKYSFSELAENIMNNNRL